MWLTAISTTAFLSMTDLNTGILESWNPVEKHSSR